MTSFRACKTSLLLASACWIRSLSSGRRSSRAARQSRPRRRLINIRSRSPLPSTPRSFNSSISRRSRSARTISPLLSTSSAIFAWSEIPLASRSLTSSSPGRLRKCLYPSSAVSSGSVTPQCQSWLTPRQKPLEGFALLADPFERLLRISNPPDDTPRGRDRGRAG